MMINRFFRFHIVNEYGFLFDCKNSKEYKVDYNSASVVKNLIKKDKVMNINDSELYKQLKNIGFILDAKDVNNDETV